MSKTLEDAKLSSLKDKLAEKKESPVKKLITKVVKKLGAKKVKK